MGRDAEPEDAPNTELYARLHLSPDASEDDIKRAYRQWAQVYHPDKHQTPQMQDVATENFQRIREAYEILSDDQKRQIYDIYGMEGLNSDLQLGPKLKTREEVNREFERLQRHRQERNLAARVSHAGSTVVHVSLAQLLESFDTGPTVTGMSSTTQVKSQLSKNDALVLGGSILMRHGAGGGSLSAVFRRQTSPESSIEILAMAGLRSLITVETSRQLSAHSTGTLGISVSLVDGSVNLSNTWSRQLSESALGNIQLVVGPETAVAVGWQKQGEKNSGNGEVKLGATAFGIHGQYIRHFSSISQGRVSGKVGSTALEVEIGGERRISEHSALAMFCTVGIQGVFWKFRFTRGGQKFVLPVLLSATLNPFMATGALLLPSSLYAILKVYVIKPYLLKRKHHQVQEMRRLTVTQVREARDKAMKAQSLLKNVADRKQKRQSEKGGLVVIEAIYGNLNEFNKHTGTSTELENMRVDTINNDDDLLPPVLDVTVPLNFLVDDTGSLELHKGVKKSGLMGFCDPCPGEEKSLRVSYRYRYQQYQVVVGDYDELRIPHVAHEIIF